MLIRSEVERCPCCTAFVRRVVDTGTGECYLEPLYKQEEPVEILECTACGIWCEAAENQKEGQPYFCPECGGEVRPVLQSRQVPKRVLDEE